MSARAMRQVALLVALACAGACRRHHPPVVDEPTATTPPPRAPAAAAPRATPNKGNPLGEPVLPARDDKPRMPDGGTINGDPRGPRAADFNRVIDAAFPHLQACLDAADLPPGSLQIVAHYTVEPPGYTGAVTVRGDAPETALDCCKRIIEDLKFPEFRGPKVEQDLPFTYQKTQKPVRREIWDAAAPPANAK